MTPTPQAGAQPDGSFLISGTLILFSDSDGSGILNTGQGRSATCSGVDGFDDIGPGTQIIVRDQSDDIVGVGYLEMGIGSSDTRCVFMFHIEVPKATFYAVATSRRDGLVYAFDDLEASGWRVDLTIGP